ncbi:MAG: EAL domain-containing protein [Mariprofundus sp.]|nr:EAL domain-containing protein [Mariprofundus sp.]
MQPSKILIVDDYKELRDLYAEFLENAGFIVVKAKNYDKAVEQIDSSIDLALLDVKLEGHSGLDVLAYLRKHRPACPVIMMSGFADKKSTIEALRQGAVEYLEKPINPHELVHSIKHWLDYHATKQENHRLQDFQAMHRRLQENEQQIRMANERLNFLLTSTSAVIYASDISDHYATTFISDNIKRLCGYEAEAFTSSADFRLGCVHPDDVEHVKNSLKKGFERGSNRFEYRFQHKDGHYLWVGDEIRIDKNQHGTLEFLGFLSDITEHKHSEEKIREMAYTDLLTGLPNRSLYYDRLKQAIAQSHRNHTNMAVLFMDLDYFKPINDELGHEWGDIALIEVARRLQNCIRETDTVARLGGDEFSIILDNIESEESACMFAEKVIHLIQEPMILKNSQYVLGVSIGINLNSHEYRDVETIMRLADDAMYQAKELGRNRYCIYRDKESGVFSEINAELKLEKALRQAISNDELLIYYQPKVELKNGLITGTHALLRWNNADTGIILPDQFLPLANKTGLIVQIGKWVLRQACAQNRTWKEMGLPIVPVSVNVTAEQLRHADFSKLVAQTLQDNHLDADMLQLEISESDLMQHASAVLISLNELDAMGVKITIDNFGAGFFSLQSLKSMPVHELKMNRSLVHQIGQGGDSAQIANAIISMGHILNHQVVAEGVETEDQLQFLRKHDSDGILGSLSSPPVPAGTIAEQLKNMKSMLK